MNEVVVDRGANPYLAKIECWERDTLITKVSIHSSRIAQGSTYPCSSRKIRLDLQDPEDQGSRILDPRPRSRIQKNGLERSSGFTNSMKIGKC